MSKTRSWAIWQLQGASLALAYRGIKYQCEKDMVILWMIQRLASEYVNQVNFLANPNTKMTAIREWWRVYPSQYPIASIKLEDISYSNYKGKKGKLYTHAKEKQLPGGIDFSRGQYSSQLNALLSLWTHPSFTLTSELFETDKNTGKLSLYEFRDTFYADSAADYLVQQVVDNAASCIHLGSYLFGSPIPLDQLKMENKYGYFVERSGGSKTI